MANNPVMADKLTSQSAVSFGHSIKPTNQSAVSFGHSIKPTNQSAASFGHSIKLTDQSAVSFCHSIKLTNQSAVSFRNFADVAKDFAQHDLLRALKKKYFAMFCCHGQMYFAKRLQCRAFRTK